MGVVCAGAPPTPAIIARVEEELSWEFIQLYGLTETSPLLMINRSRSECDDLQPLGRAAKLVRAGAPAIGVTVRLSADDEVLARSNVVIGEYWNHP